MYLSKTPQTERTKLVREALEKLSACFKQGVQDLKGLQVKHNAEWDALMTGRIVPMTGDQLHAAEQSFLNEPTL